MPKLYPGRVKGNCAGFLDYPFDLALRDEQELRIAVDKAGDQPRAGNPVNVYVRTSNPLHLTPPFGIYIRKSAYPIPKTMAPIATRATSTFKKVIAMKAITAINTLGTPINAPGTSSRETTRMTPTTAALTPERKTCTKRLLRICSIYFTPTMTKTNDGRKTK